MNSLPKDTRRIQLISNPKHFNKRYINPQKYGFYRLRSKDDINQKKINDTNTNTNKNKNSTKDSTLNKTIYLQNSYIKMNRRRTNEILNNFSMNKRIGFMTGSFTSKNKSYIPNFVINKEQGDDIRNTSMTNTIYDDKRIRNIINLWNELEVMEPFRNYFLFIYKELDVEEQRIFYQNEINELIQLKNDIKSLTFNIELRIGFIKILSELNNELNQEINLNKNKNVDKFVINEMIKKLKDLTMQTVNIVKYMQKIKSVINLAPNLGKYNIDIIAQKFNFDKNYIIKMKLETNFLNEGNAKKIFNIKNDQSPFFIKIKTKDNNSNDNKTNYNISLDDKVINDIKECNYYIYKELIAYENEQFEKNRFRIISPIRKYSSAYDFYTKINFFSKENKNNKLIFNMKPNGKNFILKRNNDSQNNNIKIDSINNLKMNSSSKILQIFDVSKNSNININKNIQMPELNNKIHDDNRPNDNNSDFINFQKEYNKNNVKEQNVNKSEIISHNLSEYLKPKRKDPFSNDSANLQNKSEDKFLWENNVDNNEIPDT